MKAKRNHFGHIIWTPQLDRLLGLSPDGYVGSLIGCSDEAVARRRRRLGIAAFRPEVTWTSKMDSILGTVTDRQAAEQLGVSPLSVRIRRHRLGIRAAKGRDGSKSSRGM